MVAMPEVPERRAVPTARELLAEQIRYYRARAPEYDQWFRREGRYDLGPEHTGQWEDEVGRVSEALLEGLEGERVLELACGTGLWTAELAPRCGSVYAIDSSPEALALARERIDDEGVSFVEADLFEWDPPSEFDVVFFSFWISHVPPELFGAFWRLVASALKPGGRALFLDNRHYTGYRWPDEQNPQEEDWIARRELNDGTEFRIVKIFYGAEDLTTKLHDLGWRAEIRETERFFVYGSAAPPD